MLWSRIAKARILDIARMVFGISWASARSKTKKAALADAMETAFAPGDTSVGLSAGMHTAALAWTPPGFAAFDTGRIGDEPDDDAQAETHPAPDAAEPEVSGNPEADAGDAAATEPASETAEATAGNDRAALVEAEAGQTEAEPDSPGAEPVDATAAVDIADSDGGMPPVPMNGHVPAPDPLEIPEFLRRVH